MSGENEREAQSTADFLREMLTDPSDGEAFARAFLRTGALSTAVDTLLEAREEAGLTQEEVARALGTKQPAIARLEADTTGSLSLRRYLDFALACGRVPFITLAPIREAIKYVLEEPEKPLTADAFMRWRLSAPVSLLAPGNVNPSVPNFGQQSQSITSFGFEPPRNTIRFYQDFIVKQDEMRQFAVEAKSSAASGQEFVTTQSQATARLSRTAA